MQYPPEKKAAIRLNLIAALKETDPDVFAAYNNWIDALLEAKRPITRQALDIYQNNLDNYTDNKQVKIKILEIATTNAYTEFAWSMKIYEKDYRGNGTFIGVKQNKANGIDLNSSF